MKIGNRDLLQGPPYIVAEISGNHLGNKQNAFRLIQAAKAAGADSVKFQAYEPDTITINHDGPGFKIHEGTWKGRRLYDLYKEAHTPFSWFPSLFECARETGITCFASVFDPGSVNMLERLGAPCYKIASFEIIDHPLIRYVASKKKPIILSTGMASEEEVKEADDLLGPDYPHLFLHCISGYPTPTNEAHLEQIERLSEVLGMRVGLSDHTMGHDVAVAATVMKVPVIEKHLTLSRADGGPDGSFSMEPDEFREMVKATYGIWQATVSARRPTSEYPVRMARRSLYAVQAISAGQLLSYENVRAIRPGYGLPPKFLELVVGRRAKRDIAFGSPLSWDLVQE